MDKIVVGGRVLQMKEDFGDERFMETNDSGCPKTLASDI